MKRILNNETYERVKYVVKNRSLLAAGSIILFNGYSKTSLEMIRLHIHHKLVKKYRRLIKNSYSQELDKIVHTSEPIEHRKIWILWYQGIESAPDIVKLCYSKMLNLNDKEVILITQDNIKDYVTLPDNILIKFEQGKISHAHFSDILRVELLYQHGGIWLDSTVLCSKRELPKYIERSSLFFYQLLKPGKDGHSILCSSWVMSASKGNPFLGLVRRCLHDYWSQNNSLEDYFLLHIIISALLQECPDYYESLIKVCNSTPHTLLLSFNREYTPELYEFLIKNSSVHKLTYKYNNYDSQNDTILNRLLSEGCYEN
ncbi:capsular polysaccharide synthesis protein [Vibrio fluvialis]|nr:capsular polysaccharide synthesis protein [Vibrio fluvialis]